VWLGHLGGGGGEAPLLGVRCRSCLGFVVDVGYLFELPKGGFWGSTSGRCTVALHQLTASHCQHQLCLQALVRNQWPERKVDEVDMVFLCR
jgi:hypothetical protein